VGAPYRTPSPDLAQMARDPAGWIGSLWRAAVCSHAFVWRGEVHRFDSSRHRRTRWASTTTEQCERCGVVRERQPLEPRGVPAVTFEVDTTDRDLLQKAANTLRSRGYQTGDETLVLRASLIEDTLLSWIDRRIARVEG